MGSKAMSHSLEMNLIPEHYWEALGLCTVHILLCIPSLRIPYDMKIRGISTLHANRSKYDHFRTCLRETIIDFLKVNLPTKTALIWGEQPPQIW